MKSKLYLLVILLIIFMPVKIFAMEYIAEITGSDVIYSKSDNENINQRMKSSISIDVSNLYNISYLELYVTYDTNLVGINTCSTFNFIATGCDITRDKKIYYIYKDSLYDSNKHMFNISFMYNDNTPKSGNTKIDVTIKNAKDKDGNSVIIKPISKEMKFAEPIFKIKKTE